MSKRHLGVYNVSTALSVSLSVGVKCQTQLHPNLLSLDSSRGSKGSQSVFLIEVFHVSFASAIEFLFFFYVRSFLLCILALFQGCSFDRNF